MTSLPASDASTRSVGGVAPYIGYCADRFHETLLSGTRYTPTICPMSEAEIREVIDVCNSVVEPLGKRVSDERWVSYMDVVRWAQSARHVVDMEAFKAVCVLNCVTFVWDDMDPALHDFEAFLPKLRGVCEKYYGPADAEFAYEGARAFVTSDHMFRDTELRRTLCTTSLDQYFRYRVTDVGVDFWMKMSYPIYRHDEFTEHAKSGLAARMTARGLYTVNDLYSYDREVAQGQVTNCFLHCDVSDPDAFRSFFEERLAELAEDLRCIATFDPVTRDILFDLVHGNYIWSNSNKRYRDKVNSVNSLIR